MGAEYERSLCGGGEGGTIPRNGVRCLPLRSTTEAKIGASRFKFGVPYLEGCGIDGELCPSQLHKAIYLPHGHVPRRDHERTLRDKICLFARAYA